MLAAVANKEYVSVEEAAEKIVKVVDTIEPTNELVQKYEAKYNKFKQVYPTVKGLFDIIKE